MRLNPVYSSQIFFVKDCALVQPFSRKFDIRECKSVLGHWSGVFHIVHLVIKTLNLQFRVSTKSSPNFNDIVRDRMM